MRHWRLLKASLQKKNNKKGGFFLHLLDPPPHPKVWKISRNFAVKKGQKRAKMHKKRQKIPFSHNFIKLWILPRHPPPPVWEKMLTFYFFEGFPTTCVMAINIRMWHCTISDSKSKSREGGPDRTFLNSTKYC